MKHHLGSLQLDMSFELTKPWTVLFGASGSGKSTILRSIAGLTQPDRAKIVLQWNNQPVVVTDTASRTFVPTHHRPVRWAAQTTALFPHMTVRQNLAFASEIKGADSEQAIDHAMQRFRIHPLADRKPAVLSGGERQRVSIARAAIAANGRLLLLDEPFTGLDLPLRDQLLADLQSWLALTRTPVLSVTHDVAEALQLKAQVLKLSGGRIIAQGPAAVALAEERLLLLSQLNATNQPST